MSFEKRFASESTKVDPSLNKIANIFGEIGKDEVDEIELARKAKEMDIPLDNISKYTKTGANGKLSLKWG